MKGYTLSSLTIRIYDRVPEGRIRHWLRTLMGRVTGKIPRRGLVNLGDYVLQVGTPSPATIHHYLDIVGPEGRVIVVEPEDENFARLSADPIITDAANVTLLQRAAWCRREHLSFTVSKSKYDHKIAVPDVSHDNDYVPDNYRECVLVQADTVDNMLAELGITRVDYAEIHVNGAEVEVLHGMAESLGFTARLHVKGHALVKETGEPINKQISALLHKRGFRTVICARTKARDDAATSGWRTRAGDVYAAK